MRVQKIVSGGQTGVDRAALDAAKAIGCTIGGWCPAGRRAEDGIITSTYPLQETPSDVYAQRTAWNVRDSDGTLVILADANVSVGGTTRTIQETERQNKPLLVVNIKAPPEARTIAIWLEVHNIRVLNIAGPRESESPGIYQLALAFMKTLLQ